MPSKVHFNESWMPEPNSGCWLWTGYIDACGYGGAISYGSGLRMRAHCLSWTLHRGNVPKGLCVLHRCDTRSCVNPDHLFLGTRHDNAEDATRKHRHARGEKHGNRKLTNEIVRAIKISTETNAEIARELGVPQNQVSRIKRGIRWAHIEVPKHTHA
jgi:HNH endonuclease